MNIRELLEKLGIAEDKQADAETQFKAFIDGQYVPKSRFNEVNEEKKTLSQSIKDYDKQLEDLKKSADDVAGLKAKIGELQAINETAAKENEKAMQALRMSTAIQLAIGDSANDASIVEGLINRDKLVLGDDNKVVGLEEQLATLRKEKAFLFKQDQSKPATYDGANKGAGANVSNPFMKETLNLTEQAKLMRENPAQAQQLAKAAGVNI